MIKRLNKIIITILSLAIIGTVFPASASEKVKNDFENSVVHDENGDAVLELTSDNSLGFKKIDGSIKFYGVTGEEVKSSWINNSGKWYYFDELGNAVVNWKQILGKWYYFASDYSMSTGWLKKDGKWYYLGEDGVMRKSQSIDINNICYSFDENGVMIDNKSLSK